MLTHENAFKNIFNTVREGILILDENIRVLSANRSFFNAFKVDPEDTIGALLYDLGNGQWNIPHLRVLLEDILPKNDTVDDYEIEHNFESIGRKTMLLNACKVIEKKKDRPIILLAIEDITQRKEIEAGLEKSRKELAVIKETADEISEFAESIINTVREPLIALDQDLRVVTASRSFYEFFKVKPEETIGQLIYDLGNKQWDIPKLRELLETILPQKVSFDNYEVSHDFSTIGRRVMLLNARQMQRVSGKELIILLAIENITESKTADEILRASEENYRCLFESSRDAIMILEPPSWTFVSANPATVDMFRAKSAEDLVTRGPLGLSPEQKPDGRASAGKAAEMIETAMREGSHFFEWTHKRISGEEFPATVLMTRMELGGKSFLQATVRDISEQKRADEAVAMMARFPSENPNPVLKMDKNGLLLYANEASKYLLAGLDNINKCVAHDFLIRLCQSALEKDIPEIHEVTCAERIYLLNIVPFKRSNYVNIYGSDITELKKLEEQLLQSQKMEAVGLLAGGIAHDFNNILSLIMGYGYLLQMKIDSEDPLRENVDQILVSADRAAEITHSLLAFSRKQLLNPQLININAMMKTFEKFLSRLIGEDIEVSINYTDNDVISMADSGQIEQVLLNLATNARDAMPHGGHLMLDTQLAELDDTFIGAHGYGEPGMFAVISVSDTGSGMDKETMAKIFEPFFTTKEAEKGTGLGLAMVYGIIKQHNGYINVYSEPGMGTTFRIYLPAIKSPEEVIVKIAIEPLPTHGNEMILVAEDNSSLRKLFSTVLGAYGYKVIPAEDGEDAIRKFIDNKDKIQLVMLDMIMPKKSGKEAYDRIKQIRPDIKTLFSSGYTADRIDKDSMLKEGFDFIMKPVLPKDLLRKIREVLDK